MIDKPYQAVVILGGGRDKNTGALSKLSTDRLDTGAQILKQGIAEHGIVMGKVYKSYTPEVGLFEQEGALLRREYLISTHGIDPDKIETVVDECMDTVYEAIAARRIVKEKGWNNILLDTSVNHMPRALIVFKRVLGKYIQIDPVVNPCPDSLNPEQEKILYQLTEKFLATLPGEILDPKSWDVWYKEHKSFYDEQRSIHESFRQRNTEGKDAYASIHTIEK